MTLKERLNDLVDKVAEKFNWLLTKKEDLSNKKGYLNSTNADHYPNIPAVVQGLAQAVIEAGGYTDDQINILVQALADKVDKIPGYGLSKNDFTDALKTKLQELEGTKYLGSYPNLTALKNEYPEGQNESWHNNKGGWYADVGGTEEDDIRYTWDSNDFIWIESGLAGLTPEQVLQLLLENSDVNILTDNLKDKLENIETGAQKNVQSDWNESNNTKDAYIKNKPTKLSQFSNTETNFVSQQWVNDQEYAKEEDIGDGTLSINGTGALTGSGSFSANQKANKNVNLDLSQETKDDIAKGVEAKNELDNHLEAENNPHNVTAGQVGSYTKEEADNKFSTSDTTYTEITESEAKDKNSNTARLISGRRLFDSFSKHITEWWDALSISISKITGLQDVLDDKADKTVKVEGTGSLVGGGDLSENRNIDLTQDAKDDIQKGVATKDKLDNLKIGGRNLLRRTSEEWQNDIVIGGFNMYPFGGGTSTPTIDGLKEGEKFILSSEVKGDNQRVRLHVRFFSDTGSKVENIYSAFADEDTETRLLLPFEIPQGAVSFVVALRKETSGSPGTTIYYRRSKLEKETTPSDWTPALEEQVTDFDEENQDSLAYLKNRDKIASKTWVEAKGYLTSETTYNPGTKALLETGIDTEDRVWQAKIINEGIKHEIEEYDSNFDDYAQILDNLTPDITV